MKSQQEGSVRKRKAISSLVVRFFVFIFLGLFLLISISSIDEKNISKYFFKKSLAKNITPTTNRVTEAEKKLYNSLNEEKEAMEVQRKLIEEERARLEEQKKEIEQKLAEVKQIKSDIDKTQEDKIKISNERLEKMVIAFTSMKPATTASVFENMDVNLVVKIIDKMDAKKVAPILDKMNNIKTTEITSAFALVKDKGIEASK